MRKALVLVTVISCVLLTSCKSTTEEKTVTISMLYNNVSTAPYKEDWLILNKYEELKNVKLDVRLGDNEDYATYIDQALSSDSIPDIILNCWPEGIREYADNGRLLPFSEYEDLMPYYKQYILDNDLQSEVDKLRLADGEYYLLPGFQRDIQVQQWIYRKDLFDENGLKSPESYEELFDDLLLLKELYPNSTPISASWNGAHLLSVMGAGYGISSGWSGNKSYDFDKGFWFYTPASENYKAMLQYLNSCYIVGVLDPEIFGQSNEEFIEKIVDGRAFVAVTWITSGFDNWNATLEENGVQGGEWFPMNVPESTIGISKLPAVSTIRKGLVMPKDIVDNENFEEILEFVDWAVYSDEGIELTYWGVEGTTFKTSNNTNSLLPNIKSPKTPDGEIDMTVEYGVNLFFNLNESVSFEDYKKPEYIVDFLNESNENGDTQSEIPLMDLSDDNVKIVSLLLEDVDSFSNDQIAKFVFGELDFNSDWESYISELENRGCKIIEDIWNASINDK